MKLIRFLVCMSLVSMAPVARASGVEGAVPDHVELNPVAIGMFLLFVLVTLGITRWASRKTRTTKDFYSAGGGISGFQNGLAIAGDYMSAASFLGLSGMVYLFGFDGLIYSIGFLVGWPFVMFLLAEPSAQSRQVHVRRCGCLSLRAGADPLADGQHVAGGRDLLSGRADGRRGQTDPVVVRIAVLDGGGHRRRVDGGLRVLRRHDARRRGCRSSRRCCCCAARPSWQ